jgi:hypothetical protein
VVAGTAGAVRHHQNQRYARQDQERYEQQVQAEQALPDQQQQAMAAQQAAAPAAAAPAEAGYVAELEKLAQLKNQGIITEDEFQAKKAQILGI